MREINYISASKLIEKARDIMIPLENQAFAQESIATIISMHLSKIQALNRGADANEIVSSSAFVVGSTGSGKSFIIKSLAESCGLQFEQIDCTSIVQAGMRGKSVGDCFSEIIKHNPDFFKNGSVINLDEFDKIFYKNDSHYDCYSPMQDFLKIFEGGNYSFTASNGTTSVVNLDRTLILLSGACSNIKSVLEQKHTSKKLIGFNFEIDTTITGDSIKSISLDNLIDYGLMPELASRINTVINIPDIDLEGYKKLITYKSKSSAINQFKNLFSVLGVNFAITDSAVERVAMLCIERNVGARSVRGVLNELLIPAYSYVDDNPSYNKITLQIDDNDNLSTKYETGERFPLPIFAKESVIEDFNITRELFDDNSINEFCDRLCGCMYLKCMSYEPLIYNFLQTVCRYMSDAVANSEKKISNVIKLAKATYIQSKNENYKSPFDIICGDHLEYLKGKELQIKYTVFSHYYNAFKSQLPNEYNPKILTEAINTAQKYYLQTNYKNVI